MKTLALHLIAFLISAIGFIEGNVPLQVQDGLNEQTTQIGTVYRWTKNGWEDSTIWEMNQAVPKSFLGEIHPLIWGATTLMLGLIGLLWLTRESEVDQLFKELDQFLAEPASTTTRPFGGQKRV